MLLQVVSPEGTRSIECDGDKCLAAVLGAEHIDIDVRCGMRNLCSRCRVKLKKGRFLIGDKTIHDCATDGEREVNSCIVRALSCGEIVVPRESLAVKKARVAQDFDCELDLAGSETCALAVDIGTTTVAAALVKQGRILQSAGNSNLQFKYGDNVASRISYAKDESSRRELQRAVAESVNRLIREMELEKETIDVVAVAGNTVMTHLFFAYDVESIGVLPFTPLYRKFPAARAGEIGLALDPETPVLAAPSISGYVGGDITAGLLVTGFGREANRNELFIDVGTNCEMVLKLGGKIYCTAAAAGPAFEGANISCGGRAAPGAVDHIRISERGQTDCHVIGGVEPVSLCGSAMVDFIAECRRAELMNELGRFDREKLAAAGLLRSEGNLHFMKLCGGLVVSEADVEQILKAKAAVYAGIVSLLEHCSGSLEDLDVIYLAGGFARYLDLKNAAAIRMLPDMPDKIRVCGNTSLAGAVRLGAHPERMAEFERLIDLPEDVPLNVIPGFEMNYIESLMLD